MLLDLEGRSGRGGRGVCGARGDAIDIHLHDSGASVALVLGIHRLMSQGLTPTNVVGNAVATVVVAKWEGALDEDELRQRARRPCSLPLTKQALFSSMNVFI